MEISVIVSWIGTVIGIILNISPIIMFWNIFLGKESIRVVPEAMLIFNILCSSLWACYWKLQEDKFVPFFSAFIGLDLSEVFALVFLFYYAEKNWKKYLVYAFLEINLVIEFNYVLLKIIADYNIIGKIAVLVNIVNYIAPGQNIAKVIREKDYTLIPIASTLSGASCGLTWFIFGLLIMDWNTIIPNALGLIFAFINCTVWAYYYCQSGSKKEKKDEVLTDDKKEKMEPNKEEF